jgi:hypothetical protein
MATDRLRVEGNERMDLQDFQYLVGEQQVAAERQLLSQLICSPDRERKWVLSGFAISNPTGAQVQVTKGRALLAEFRNGAAYYGMLTTEGDATKIVDINTYANGVYGIYVRFEEIEGAFQPRIFWNAAGLGSEYPETIATRYLANWAVRVEAASPGEEWLQIGTVNRADMALVDMRDFYFEGPVDDSYKSGWSTDGGGSANDRSADRKTYGVSDFQKFSAATRQCLEDIKGRGLRRWWERDIGGMNLGFDAAPVEDRLALGDADFYLDGGATKRWQFAPNDHLTYDRTGNVLALSIGADKYKWDATAYFPETADAVDLGKSDKRFNTLYLGGLARFAHATADEGERNWQISIAEVDGAETLRIGTATAAWAHAMAGISFTRTLNGWSITKVNFPNGLYYDVANYALCADTTYGALGKTDERWKYVYADLVHGTTVQGPAVVAETAFLPDAHNGANLGADDKYFNSGWVTTLTMATGIVNTVIKPDVDEGADIGTNLIYFNNAYLESVFIGTKLMPRFHNQQDLGDVNTWFRNGYVDNFNMYTATIGHSLVPDDHGGASLGTASPLKWFSTTYTLNLMLSTDVGGGVGTDLRPSENGTLDLGHSSYRWKAGYVNSLYSAWVYTEKLSRADAGDILVYYDLVPSTNGAANLGTVDTTWGTLWVGTITGGVGGISSGGVVSGAGMTCSGELYLPGFAGSHGREIKWEWAAGGTWSPWNVLYSEVGAFYSVGLYTQYWTKLGGTLPILVSGQVLIGEAYDAHINHNVSEIHGVGAVANRGFLTLRFNEVDYVIPVWYWTDMETP